MELTVVRLETRSGTYRGKIRNKVQLMNISGLGGVEYQDTPLRINPELCYLVLAIFHQSVNTIF